MIFDTHAHYEDESFDEDRGTLLAGMRENNIGRIVNVGSTLKTSEASIELAKQYDDIYASVGIHPSEVTFPIKGADEGAMTMDESRRMIPDIMSKLEDMSSYDKCVAIGEIGLDYYWDKEPENHALQREWFLAQLELANKVNKPVIVHSREASQETFDILKDAKKRLNTSAVVHCYSGSAEMAIEYVKLGFYIGVGGVITFKNGRKLRETVEVIPLESVLLETDAPYMAPTPFRGKRNDSTLIRYMVERIAELKGVSEDKVEDITWANACDLYGL